MISNSRKRKVTNNKTRNFERADTSSISSKSNDDSAATKIRVSFVSLAFCGVRIILSS